MKVKDKSKFHPNQITFLDYSGRAEALESARVWINIPSEPQDYIVGAWFFDRKSYIHFDPDSVWSENREFESRLDCSSGLEDEREILEAKLAVIDYLIEHSEQIISAFKRGRVSVPLED